MLIAPVGLHTPVVGVNTSAATVEISPAAPGGAATTVITALAVLLIDATSICALDTLTLLEICPTPYAATVTVCVTTWPGANVPLLHVIVLPFFAQPADAPTKKRL